MLRDEIAKILRQELGIDEEYQDWSYRAADHILAMPVKQWEPITRLKWNNKGERQYPTLQEVIEGKVGRKL